MNEPTWIQRGIEVFSLAGDSLVDEWLLGPCELGQLQEAWGVAQDSPMVDGYQVETPEQVSLVEALTGRVLDLDTKAYFVTCYCTDTQACRAAGGYKGMFPPPRELPAFPDAVRVMPKTPSE